MGFLCYPAATTNQKGQALLLFMLFWQVLFLGMCLSDDTVGLQWNTLVVSNCNFATSYEVQFFSTRYCGDLSAGRFCFDFGDQSDSSSDLNKAINDSEDNYSGAGGLAGTCLFFTIVLFLIAALGYFSDPFEKPWSRGAVASKVIFLLLDVLCILFLLAAAATASDSEAINFEVDNCDSSVGTSYGVGICSFTIFWVLFHHCLFFGIIPGTSTVPADSLPVTAVATPVKQ